MSTLSPRNVARNVRPVMDQPLDNVSLVQILHDRLQLLFKMVPASATGTTMSNPMLKPVPIPAHQFQPNIMEITQLEIVWKLVRLAMPLKILTNVLLIAQ